MKKLVITFNLDEEDLGDEDGSTMLRYRDLEVSGDLTESERYSVAEHWGQSDTYWVDICADIINVL